MRRVPHDSSILLPQESRNPEPYWWNLLSQWFDGLPEIYSLENASLMIPGLSGILQLESPLQD